jgi:type IV secretory pathway VirB10-like protein
MSQMPYRALGATLLFLAATAAQAQYVWIGPGGTRQYSDRPPPPGTPASKIVKSPGRAAPELAPAPAATPVEPVAANPAAKPMPPKGPPTLAEQEAAYRARAKARDEANLKAQEEAQRARQLAERCNAARETQAQLASGTRIARYGQDGQKSYMTDAERAARAAQVSQALQDCR